MSTTYLLSKSESPSTGHSWNEQAFHILIISMYMSTTYKLSESESPSTGHGWVGMRKVHIMIISVYIWAQLTSWVNKSHRPQGMVEMSKVFTLWSSVCTYECNLPPEWTQVTVHSARLEWARFHIMIIDQCVHMSTIYSLQTEWIQVTVHRAWLKWARFSHYDHQCVHMSTTYMYLLR